MLLHPATVLGLGDGGAHCGVLCDASLPTFMLTHWARDRNRGEGIPLEQVVHLQTRRTAELYGFGDRGLLAPGYLADLNVIDHAALTLEPPEMVYDLPAAGKRLVQRARGYAATVKSGVGRAPGRRGDGGAARPPAAGTATHAGLRTAHGGAPRVAALSPRRPARPRSRARTAT